MIKFNIIQFLCIFGIIYLVEMQEPETLYEYKVTRAFADQSLEKIQSSEALPMVLLKRHNKLLMPRRVHNVTLLGRKMIHGTDFNSTPSSEQMFFCPEENTDKKCLVPKTFDGIQRLQCASEATPDLQSEDMECGHDEMSTFYTSLYPICENDQYQFATKVIPFYRICYNKKLQKTLFTIHIINSPELLDAKLLVREREVKYRMMEMDEFDVFSSHEPNDVKTKQESISPYSTTKAGYRWQKLVPSEDMALALWRKTTFQRTNTALQHEQLISLWNKITEYVRFNAIKMYNENFVKTFVYTGIVDADSAYKVDDGKQLSNIWLKLVFASTSIYNDASYASHGVAILMNNFVDTDSKALEEYCDQDLCIDTLSNEFKEVKGHVRCCSVNKKILDLFMEIDVNLKELYIPNINIPENIETMEDDLSLFPNEAAELIGEIKANEILPLILISNPFDFQLKVPKKIQRIATKNKRIVNGSEFFTKNFEKQLFFCPGENSDEECLAPQAIGRFELLQCTKEATPVVRQLSTSSRCGIDDSGILYEVIYEICPAQQPYQYQITEFKLYEFCYDANRKKILYVRHKIMSKRLLISKLLFREREMEYPLTTDTALPLANYQELVAVEQPENEDQTSSTDTKKSPYKLQKLVPSEDMAFALWKKSTYRYVNVALQHESLIPLWNDINRYVRDNAFSIEPVYASSIDPNRKDFKYHHSEDSIYTGVLYKQSSSLGNNNNGIVDQIPEIWFKIIHTEKSISYEEGIVILMNNFLTPRTDRSTSSNPEQNTLEKYCQNNLCDEKLQIKFMLIGGEIRCCTLTSKIAQLLDIPNIHHNYVTLPIHYLIE